MWLTSNPVSVRGKSVIREPSTTQLSSKLPSESWLKWRKRGFSLRTACYSKYIVASPFMKWQTLYLCSATIAAHLEPVFSKKRQVSTKKLVWGIRNQIGPK